MKKWFLVFLSAIMVFSMTVTAMADVDLASMSDDELVSLIQSATDELNSRHLGEERFVLRNSGGITIYATGKLSISGSGNYRYVDVEVVIDNQTDQELSQNISYQTVNGTVKSIL